MLTMPCEDCILKAMCVCKDVMDLFLDCKSVHNYVSYDLDDMVEIGRRIDRVNEGLKRQFSFETDVRPLIPDVSDPMDGPYDEYFIIFDYENGKDFVMHERYNVN